MEVTGHRSENVGQTANHIPGIIDKACSDGKMRDCRCREEGTNDYRVRLKAQLKRNDSQESDRTIVGDLPERLSGHVFPSVSNPEQAVRDQRPDSGGDQRKRDSDESDGEKSQAMPEDVNDENGPQ